MQTWYWARVWRVRVRVTPAEMFSSADIAGLKSKLRKTALLVCWILVSVPLLWGKKLWDDQNVNMLIRVSSASSCSQQLCFSSGGQWGLFYFFFSAWSFTSQEQSSLIQYIWKRYVNLLILTHRHSRGPRHSSGRPDVQFVWTCFLKNS